MIRKIIPVIFIFLLTCNVNAQQWDQNIYDDIVNSVNAPQFPERYYSITEFGASENASAKENQAAINKAIEVCSADGGGYVTIPEGTWNTGALRLRSGVNLRIGTGANVVFAFEPELYPLVETRWEGLDIMNYSPCIYACRERNVAISGNGTVNGNGSADTWWQWNGAPRYGFRSGTTPQGQNMPFAGDTAKWNATDVMGHRLTNRSMLLWMADHAVPVEERIFGQGCGMRPQLINFYQCSGVLIEDVTLLNSPFWVIHPVLSDNVTVRRCRIYNEGPNGDGCNPESCRNVIIEDCIFHTGDDCIAIKSGRNADGRRAAKPSSGIIVRRCTMEDGHGGVVIGSEASGGVSNVFAHDCRMDSPNLDRVLRIKTNTCRGGIIENICMRDIEVGRCREAVMRINLVYEPNEPSERGHIPTVRNVLMERVTCNSSRYGILLNGLEEESQIYDVHIRDCSFTGVTDQPVRLTGKSHNIFYENLTVNGKTILPDNPYSTLSEWVAMSEMKRNPQPWLLDFSSPARYPDGKWSYSIGLELEAMLHAAIASGNDSILGYVMKYPAKMIAEDGTITGYSIEDYNLDAVRTGHMLLQLAEANPESYGKGTRKALETLFRQLEKQPRTKQADVWWHKAIYPDQVWLDGTFMGLPFYTSYVSANKSPRKAVKYYDDAVRQLSETYGNTYDQSTGLWKHAWDASGTIFWANPMTGQSAHTWARALGWFSMSMIELLDVLPQDYQGRGKVEEMFRHVIEAVIRYQDTETGAWYDVMDVEDKRNYLEATATAMFTCSILKGVRMGYLDSSCLDAGIKGYGALLRDFIKVNADGTVSLTGCCSVSGLGPADRPARDGSFDYYMSEPVIDNDPKGIGPLIWASLEMDLIQAE